MYEIILPCDLDMELQNIERDVVSRALTVTDNNKTDAAKMLGIKRTRLIFKLKKLGLFKTRREYYFDSTREQLRRYRESKAEKLNQQNE